MRPVFKFVRSAICLWETSILALKLALFIYLFISFFFNLGDPFNALALFFLGAQVHKAIHKHDKTQKQ